MPKILITGINGFAGTHLNNYLSQQGDEVFGTVKPSGGETHDPHLFEADILDYTRMKQVIDDVSPDYIYHLAALASPSASFANPAETISNNIGGQVNVLEAVKELKLMNTRVLVVSSAEVYGQVAERDLPIDEETPLRPTSPYAVSKLAQDFLGLQYFLSQNIQCVRVRPFNHVGPYQSPNFVIPAFAKQIAEIEKGKQEPVMKVGNLDAKKDFTDVRDIVKAYCLLMEKGENGEVYNIGTGKSYRISEILDILLSFSEQDIIVEKDPSLMRPIEIPELVCDYELLHKTTGWKPEIPLETSLRDTLDYWRNIV